MRFPVIGMPVTATLKKKAGLPEPTNHAALLRRGAIEL